MTEQRQTNRQETTAIFDPSGSIFLPPEPIRRLGTKAGEQHFDRLLLALTLGRSPFEERPTPDQQMDLYDELRQVRAWWFGHESVALAMSEIR